MAGSASAPSRKSRRSARHSTDASRPTAAWMQGGRRSPAFRLPVSLQLAQVQPPQLRCLPAGDAGHGDGGEAAQHHRVDQAEQEQRFRDAVAARHFPGDAARVAAGARYLRDNVDFGFGERELTGLTRFYREAADLGLVPSFREPAFEW